MVSVLSKRGNRGQRSRRSPVSLSVNSNRTYETTQTQPNTSSRTVRQCVPEFSACFTKMCGWLAVLFDVSSRFQMMSKWHMGFTDQTNVETTLRKAILCASNQLQSNVSTSNSITKSFQWLSVQIPFKRKPQVLELRPKILANGVKADEARWWSIPMPAVFSIFGASPCSSRSVCFINLSICVSRLLFFPAILISSMHSDRNSPCCRFKHKHSHSGTFLHPSCTETSSNCHFQSNPAEGCPM